MNIAAMFENATKPLISLCVDGAAGQFASPAARAASKSLLTELKAAADVLSAKLSAQIEGIRS